MLDEAKQRRKPGAVLELKRKAFFMRQYVLDRIYEVRGLIRNINWSITKHNALMGFQEPLSSHLGITSTRLVFETTV